MREISMQEEQKAALEVMRKIADVCEEQGLAYSLFYGTLIGAIRHKGFIPWDDDIDIAMPRPDYERFCKYCTGHAEELKPFKLLNMDTCKDYPYMISRMSDERYLLKVTNEKDFGLGVFVDIYPLDGLGNEYDQAYALMAKVRKYPRLIFLATRRYYHFGTTKGWGKRMAKFCAFCIVKLIGKNILAQRLLSLVDTTRYESSRYVGCAVWGAGSKVFVFDKEKLGGMVQVDFEGEKFRAFEGWDYLLKMWYGDYMQLPPEEDRVPHHLYTAYKK